MKNTLTILFALIAMASLTFAQQGGGQRGQRNEQRQQGQRQGGGGNGMVALLGRANVQAELNLSDDQKTKITALIPQRNRQAGQGGNRGQGEQTDGGQRGGNRESQAELEKKVAEILNDKQKARLAELVIQRAGNRAVFDEKVAAKLSLTEEQKSKIDALREKQRASRQQRGSSGQPEDRNAARAAREKAEKELDAEIGKLLTEKQKTELKGLGGKPFNFDN